MVLLVVFLRQMKVDEGLFGKTRYYQWGGLNEQD